MMQRMTTLDARDIVAAALVKRVGEETLALGAKEQRLNCYNDKNEDRNSETRTGGQQMIGHGDEWASFGVAGAHLKDGYDLNNQTSQMMRIAAFEP